MSASFALPEQIDGLEKLITLASLRKEDIIATQTEARKQLQLTQEEQAKVAEAKSYITKHAELSADIQRREGELAGNQAAHSKAVSDHAAYVTFENTRLEALSASLTTKANQQAEIDKKQRAEAERLAGLSVDMERQHRSAMEALQKDALINASDKQANAIEAERLKAWEASLKKKAQALREQAANF